MKREDCPHFYKLRVNDNKRLYAACELRHGFLVKHWRCKGYKKEGCPLKEGEDG